MRNLGFRLTVATLFVLAVACIAGLAVRADDDEGSNVFRARLSSLGEVPPTLFGNGEGTFVGTLSDDGNSMDWTFDFSGLTGPASAAHIHFGPSQLNGPVFVFFCGGPRPACPDGPGHSGSISGTWTAADILAVPAQGLDAGDFAGFIRILRHGVGYANMHTPAHPGGEIRGQVHTRRHHEREHEDKN
ncbi:MAG TPA: CHRD domain-containing protein [Candidatus Dormibacteraeota bacterium]|nr:CHRD domain-containing protein [Candidatus Dormibacteraeota bacterium]